jgi:hypothetical protein
VTGDGWATGHWDAGTLGRWDGEDGGSKMANGHSAAKPQPEVGSGRNGWVDCWIHGLMGKIGGGLGVPDHGPRTTDHGTTDGGRTDFESMQRRRRTALCSDQSAVGNWRWPPPAALEMTVSGWASKRIHTKTVNRSVPCEIVGLRDRAKITSAILAWPFDRWLRCSLLTDPLAGYARRSRLASGQNSCAIITEFIFARSLRS